MDTDMLPTFKTAEEIASILRCSSKTVHRYCRTEALPFVKTKGGKLFDAAKVKRWITQRETTIKTPTPTPADDQVDAGTAKPHGRPSTEPTPARKFGRIGRK